MYLVRLNKGICVIQVTVWKKLHSVDWKLFFFFKTFLYLYME